MAKLVFDQTGSKYFSAGVNQVALSVYDNSATATADNDKYTTPVAWDGVISIANTPSGAEATALYADNVKYLELFSAEELGGTIEAYQAPVEFDKCDGYAYVADGSSTVDGLRIGQQSRSTFGLAYITQKGNDTEGSDYKKTLHIVYGAKASPSEATYETINDSPDAITFSWEFTCTPIKDTTIAAKAIYCLEIEEKDATSTGWTALINYIYGTDGTPGTSPAFPLPAKVATLLATV